MYNFIKKGLLFLAVFGILLGSFAHASSSKFLIDTNYIGDSTHMQVCFTPFDGTNLQAEQCQNMLVSSVTDEPTYASTIKAGIASWANAHGYSGITSADVLSSFAPVLGKSFEGTTQRANSFPIFKNATVASGVAVFNLTDDGTSTGNALFPNGVITDSVNPIVSDATASYQMSWVFSNSNKTLTVTANKLTTANILSGILGQTAANGAVVKLSVWGY